MNGRLEMSVLKDKTTEISLIGEVDILSIDVFNQFIHELLDESESNLIINCEKLTYIDSLGLNILADAQMALSQKGLFIQLAKVNGNIQKLFEITKLNEAIQIAG